MSNSDAEPRKTELSEFTRNQGQAAKKAALAVAMAAGLGPMGLVGLSILETLSTIRKTRSSTVMARVSKEHLERLDDLVDCGLTNSRSESAAFLIAEGIKANTDLYDKIHEQSEVIRKAREEIRSLFQG